LEDVLAKGGEENNQRKARQLTVERSKRQVRKKEDKGCPCHQEGRGKEHKYNKSEEKGFHYKKAE